MVWGLSESGSASNLLIQTESEYEDFMVMSNDTNDNDYKENFVRKNVDESRCEICQHEKIKDVKKIVKDLKGEDVNYEIKEITNA